MLQTAMVYFEIGVDDSTPVDLQNRSTASWAVMKCWWILHITQSCLVLDTNGNIPGARGMLKNVVPKFMARGVDSGVLMG